MAADYLKLQLVSELREALRIKDMNVELLEQIDFTARWLLDYCEKNGVEPPNLDRLRSMLERAQVIVAEVYPDPPPESATRLGHPEDWPV
jgi:hypothetical protein